MRHLARREAAPAPLRPSVPKAVASLGTTRCGGRGRRALPGRPPSTSAALRTRWTQRVRLVRRALWPPIWPTQRPPSPPPRPVRTGRQSRSGHRCRRRCTRTTPPRRRPSCTPTRRPPASRAKPMAHRSHPRRRARRSPRRPARRAPSRHRCRPPARRRAALRRCWRRARRRVCIRSPCTAAASRARAGRRDPGPVLPDELPPPLTSQRDRGGHESMEAS